MNEYDKYQEWKDSTKYNETNKMIKKNSTKNTEIKKHFIVIREINIEDTFRKISFFITNKSFDTSIKDAFKCSENYGGKYIIYEAVASVEAIENKMIIKRLYLTEKGAH